MSGIGSWNKGIALIIEIDPTVDFACKMLLGNPQHPAITIHFLNAVLRLNSPIVAVEVVNPIVLQEFEADKLAILDILAIDDADRRLNIEVQRTKPVWLPQRLAYYVATQLVDQIGEGDSYRQLRPSIGICILNAILFGDLDSYHSQFRLRTREGLELTNCLEIHLLELPKYACLDDNGIIEDPCEQWMCFFRRAKGSTAEQLLRRLQHPVFTEAIGVLEMISQTPEQRRLYDARLKWELDENTRIQAAIEEGEARGKIQGKIENAVQVIRSLQSILQQPISPEAELQSLELEELDRRVTDLQDKIRSRLSSS